VSVLEVNFGVSGAQAMDMGCHTVCETLPFTHGLSDPSSSPLIAGKTGLQPAKRETLIFHLDQRSTLHARENGSPG
jgi:hypothetical protein